MRQITQGLGKNGPGKNGPGKNGRGKNGPEKNGPGDYWISSRIGRNGPFIQVKTVPQELFNKALRTYLLNYLRETKKRISAVAERQLGAKNASESLIFSQITQFFVTTKNTMTF